MNIQLKKLTLTNFKGIRSMSIDFSKETTISGKNASGKTTIADSFAWILFGKNSQDKKDFEIKTLDANNEPLHRVDHEVEAVLDVDGMITTIKRSFREKWVKPKGQAEEVFSGHETTLFWNDVPVNQSDFNAKIGSLCPENVFKMITNPYGFTSLHWKEERDVLFKIGGDVSDEEIANGNKAFEELLATITGKNFDEFKKEIALKKKKIKDELVLIPARIDEANRSKPEPIDAKAIETQIQALNTEINKIEEQIADRSKANESVLKERETKLKQIYALRAKIVEFEDIDSRNQREANKEADLKREEVKSQRDGLEREQKKLTSEINENNEKIVILDAETSTLRSEWTTFNEEEVSFEDDLVACPTCHRDYPSDDVEAKKEELKTNFNLDKVKRLAAITAKGKAKKQELDEITLENMKTRELLKEVDSKLDAIRKEHGDQYKPAVEIKDVLPNPEIAKLREQIKVIQEVLDAPETKTDGDLTEKRTNLRSQIDELKKQLSVTDQIEKTDLRIKELEGQAKSMGQEIADLEKMEFTMSEFTKKKIESIEDKINSKFSLVRWKMFNQLVNGGEEECCVATILGIPFPDVNTAGQINAGLDIINALSTYYGVSAPIFVDHAESVNQLLPTNSQVIKLKVVDPLWIVPSRDGSQKIPFSSEEKAKELADKFGGTVQCIEDGKLKVESK